MRNLPIAYGDSCKALHWQNNTITFDELKERLRTTSRTRETVQEYAGMSTAQRDTIKDCGGFVAGVLRDGRRTVTSVESRSMITLDADQITSAFIDVFETDFPYAAVFYTTHGSTEAAPRGRIIIPLTRDVNPDEFVAISRYVAQMFGIDCFDECSYKPNQLMFWPTTSSDGTFIYKEADAEWLDPDAILSTHPEWTDPTQLPASSREKKVRAPSERKAQDPLEKDGVVGAFCRTYSITEAISKFLSDVYSPVDAGNRYTYINGTSAGGLVVYDDKFAYSHHATDPASHKLCNAFDLVRIHRFGDLDEKGSFQAMCNFAMRQDEVKRLMAKERMEHAKKEFTSAAGNGNEPIPFGEYSLKPFPIDALPDVFRDYAIALSENVQTPVDMAGCAALSVMATCLQGKYVINGKPGWTEQLSLYIMEIASPSERKSAIQHAMVKPISEYENEYNRVHAAAYEASRMMKSALEQKRRITVDKYAKGNVDQAEVEDIATRIAEFKEKKPLRLFVDDITPEKLASVLSENDGRMSILSSEAGIFDVLAGAYSRSVNIDVFLKAYSGDEIRVDRIGRESLIIQKPALSILLMAQPGVISKVMKNDIFKDRGLTARFLYSMPASMVGSREFDTPAVPAEVEKAYHDRVINMLEDEYRNTPEVITLTPEARVLEADFTREVEAKLVGDLADIAEWSGRISGNALRIAGLLCRASTTRYPDIILPKPLVVDKQTMENAITLTRYFLNHAKSVFDVMPENSLYNKAHRILKMLKEKDVKEFTRRDAMRNCHIFKTVEEIQPVLNYLDELGYISVVEAKATCIKGKQPMARYIVNPWVASNYEPPVLPPTPRKPKSKAKQ